MPFPFRSALLALLLAACPTSAQEPPAPVDGHPALWRVADADTTIYLFGTVHALPEGAEWLKGTVAGALLSSDTLVTEVLPGTLTDPAFLKRYTAAAMLPEAETLRGLLTDEQRTKFEAALAANGLKPDQLDRFKPWFAANTLVLAPLLKKGFAVASGSEGVIEARATKGTARLALESGDQQLALFDGMPRDLQIANLMEVVEKMGELDERMDRTVSAWLMGDVAAVAAESEAKDDDPRMAEALLYPRNRAWAEWIAERLATPGRVFVAVGAGHLAGEHSVQVALADKGLTVTRLQ